MSEQQVLAGTESAPWAAQNFPQSSAEPAPTRGSAWEETWKHRGKVIRSSSINTIPARPSEAGLLSDRVVTVTLLFPSLEEILPKSTTAPSPASLSIPGYFYFAP